MFSELPDVYNVAIQYKQLGFNTAEITDQFCGMTTIGAKVNIAQDYSVQFSFVHDNGLGKV